MKYKNLFFLFILCSPYISCSDLNLMNLVTSFVLFEDKPTSLLIPTLCWTPFETMLLTKKLFNENIFLAPSLQANRSEYFLHQILILADLSCPAVEAFLIQTSDQGYFKSPYRWLLLDPNIGSYKFDLLNKLDMPLNSDVVIAKKVNNDEYHLIEAYKISENSDVIYTTRGVWRPSSDENNSIPVTEYFRFQITKYGTIEDYRETRVISIRRQNLRRHVLTMANVITDSNETRKHLDDRLNLHQDSITKMSYMVVKICFEMLNATEKRIFTHTWGYKDKNGNWQGIIDHLLKKEADLGTLTIFTQERMKVIDYIAMVGSTAVRFVFREPPLALLENIFALPFTTAVWIAIAICVLGCAVFLYITSKWEATVGMHPLQLDGSWADVLILIIGAVLQQGCTLEPRYAAGRCVTLLLFIALTILYAAYSANIVVLLRAPSSSVRSLPDLLNSPLKLGASDFEYNRYFFKKLNEPIRKAIYNKKIAPKGKKPNFYTMKEGVEKIRRGLFAFHMELNPGYRLIQETYQEDEKCDLVEIDYINEIDPWLPGQKRSPYKDLFKINFMKIRETGIQSNIHRRLHVGKPRCSGSISTFSSVGITDMYPALIATLYGMLISLVVLILEITYKRL
ncbi:probable glutamate receptor [Melitaea cinxia]|uniref:probable glutamate receptor n=1 Tax=Melitaea cinxia TaxID=113334 RepID=UPI001E271987|nr:probable glutamate receptor [Melitaea cinxia]